MNEKKEVNEKKDILTEKKLQLLEVYNGIDFLQAELQRYYKMKIQLLSEINELEKRRINNVNAEQIPKKDTKEKKK